MLVFWFLIGSCFGSFVHACAVRYADDSVKHFCWSVCHACHHRLSFQEMIPLFSWLTLKGHCKWCGTKVPVHTCLSELIGGFLAILVFSHFQKSEAIGVFVIVFALLYSSFTDCLYGLIPDRTHCLILFGSLLIVNPAEYWTSILFSIAVLIIFSLIAIITKGLGLGDVKLMACLALIFEPFRLIKCIAIASCCALVSTFPVFFKQQLTKTTEIPFGPFLSFGTIVCLFFLP